MLISAITFHWYTNKFIRAMKNLFGVIFVLVLPVLLIITVGGTLGIVVEPFILLELIYFFIAAFIVAVLFFMSHKYSLTRQFTGTFSYKNEIILIKNAKCQLEYRHRFDDIKSISRIWTRGENDRLNFLKLIIRENSGLVNTYYVYVHPYNGFSHSVPTNLITREFNKLEEDWGNYLREKRTSM